MNIPNLLTLLRIALTPVILTSISGGSCKEALFLFGLAGITDALDGLVARATGEETSLGAFLDPVADKFLLDSSYLLLSLKGLIPHYLTLAVLSRDFTIVVGFGFIWLLGKAEKPKPSYLGKATGALQIITVIVALLGEEWLLPGWLRTGFFNITLFLTMVSGIQYLFFGLKLISLRQT